MFLIRLDFQLVLDAGEVAEWGSPKELLTKDSGMFKSLVDRSPDREALYDIVGV